MSEIVRLAGPSLDAPRSVHLLVTSKCNMACQGCYYKDTHGTWTLEDAKRLVDEMAEMGTKWLAIGGGEPTLWEPLSDLITYARNTHALRISMTTNGTIHRDIGEVDRVHISFDSWHNLTEDQLRTTLRFYRKYSTNVGINSIIGGPDDLKLLGDLHYHYLRLVDELVLIGHKPLDPSVCNKARCLFVDEWAARQKNVYYDACLAVHMASIGILKFHQTPTCYQGRTSLSLDHAGNASICSNVKEKISYTNLKETWNRLRLKNDGLPECCEVQRLHTKGVNSATQ